MDEYTETIEHFPPETTEIQIQREVALKENAGALSCDYTGSENDGWTLTSRWEKL